MAKDKSKKGARARAKVANDVYEAELSVCRRSW